MRMRLIKESPLTVPVFAECIEELRWLDITLNKMGDEQEDSQHITFVSDQQFSMQARTESNF